jgi:hypothetical protein
MTTRISGAPGRANSSHDLLRTWLTSMPALPSASSAQGLMRPLGVLPAL